MVSGDSISKGMHSALLPHGPMENSSMIDITSFIQSPRSYRYLQDVESKQLLYDLLGSKDFVGKIHITQGNYEKHHTKAHIGFLTGYKSTKIYRI
jgi:hypothetical protein